MKKYIFLKRTLIAIFIFAAVGLFASNIFQKRLYNNFIKEIAWTTNVTLAAINPERVKNLSQSLPGNISQSPDYKRVREQILNIGNAFVSRGIDAIYIMDKKGPDIYFITESTPEGNPLYVAPGTRYQLAPPELFSVFASKTALETEKYTDEFGTYISYFSPISDFQTGQQVGVLGVDVDFSYYTKTLYRSLLILWLVWLFIFILLILFLLYLQNLYKLKNQSIVNEEKIRSISDSINDGIIVVDNLGLINFWGGASEKIFNINKEKALGTKFVDLVKPENVINLKTGKKMNNFIFAVDKGLEGELFEFKFRAAGVKESSYYELSCSSTHIDNDNYLVGVFHNISIRRQEQNALQDQAKELEKLNNLMVNRELQMIDLKKELAQLRDQNKLN